MSDYINGFLYGRMLAQNPALMQYAMHQQEQEQRAAQSKEVGQALLSALGMDPTGQTAPANEVPQQQPSGAPSDYNGPYKDLIDLAARKYDFSPQEIADTIRVESGFNPTAQSPTGPQGLMQLSSAAAQDVGLDPNDRMDPAKNIMAGTAYAKQLRDEFGDKWRLAYHDGPGAMRSGRVSQAGLDYLSKFDPVSGQSDTPDLSIAPKSFQGGSKFMPSGVAGGSGVLGQDMDPIRREYLHTIQKLAQTGNPMAVSMASELYKQMQEAHMADIQRTALAKDIALTNEIPGTAAFDALVKRAILKPSNQTNINMGGFRPQVLSPEEQMTYIGKVAREGEPQPRWTKEGDIKTGAPVGITEDQSKASQYATGLNSALNTIYNIANSKDFTPRLDNPDFIGSQLEKTGLPVVSSYGTAMQSGRQQEYNQAKREAETHIIHALSGSGFTDKEEQVKTLAYLPDWGDKPDVVASKQRALAAQLEAMVNRAGPAAMPALRDAAKLAKERVSALNSDKPTRKVVRTGRNNDTGKRVVQYDDGTIEEQ